MVDPDLQRPTDTSPSEGASRMAAVSPFLSQAQLRRIARAGEHAERRAVESGWGAILTIDVSGFSALAERHAREGARGIEALSEIVHLVFGAITESVLRRDGDVLYHAGDAVCALFPARSDDERDEACRRATEAALVAHERLEASAAAAGVGLRASVGCGATRTFEVGGSNDAWILMVHGEATLDNARVDQLAARSAVTVSDSVWGRLGAERRGTRVGRGAHQITAVTRPRPSAPTRVEVADARLEAVVASLAPAVRHRFESGALPPVAEFRPVSVVFASLPELDVGDAATRERLDDGFAEVQSELARLGTPQLDVLGDKGLGFLGVFGLPPQAHDDDAVRALDAAQAFRVAFAARGIEASVGVASGVVWAGPAGASGRWCYDVVGSVTILAARLMQVADRGVLACSQTRRLAARAIEFEELPARTLKGFAAAQSVFRPLGRRTTRARTTPRLAGRATELARVRARIEALRGELEAAPRGGVVILEAEPGMGKSVMLEAARELAISSGISIFDGVADSIEVATPYFAVRGAVLDLLGIPPGSSVTVARELALARLHDDVPDLAWLGPLLDAIVPLDLPESEETTQIVGTTRAERLGDLLVALARAAVAREPVIWSIEDLHWADRASWSLCRRLVEEVPGLLLLGTSRPMPNPLPERVALGEGPDREVIVLDDLSPSALGEIVAMRLGVPELPQALLTLVSARADGNPFFAEEIALAAREAGGLVVEKGVVRIVRALESLDLPSSITGVITSRMDRLAEAERNALRCAAVLGPSFDVRTLTALVGDASLDRVDALVHRLADATFVDPDPATREGWRFRHAFLHETAYSLLTFAERRTLHATAAQAIESAPDAELASVTVLLAHHWEIAERAERAAHYYGLAGVQALEADANRECVEHLTKALRFDEAVRGPKDIDLTRARWGRMLTDASYSLGEHDAARTWGDKTFRWSGLRTPTHAGHVLSSVGLDVWRRYVPVAQADDDTRARYSEALVASSTLQTVAMWAGDKVGQLGLAVYADVVSRACVPSTGRAIAQGSMGFILLVVGMHDVGIRDATSAVEMADALGDAPTQISTKVILGLSLSSLGRNREALPPLEEARRLAERVGSGLWRHRALFQSGEPHYQLGLLDVADDLFSRCVEVARKVEPPVAGLSRAMQAACRLRKGGSADEALALLSGPDGLVLAEPGPTMMALVALGVNAWALLLAERHGEALVLARKTLTLASKQSDDAIAFARAMDGTAHAALVLTRLHELKQSGAPRTDTLPAAAELERDAAQAAAGLARLAARWPAARPLNELIAAYQLRLRGKTAKSARALERAVETASAMSQAWEHALALDALQRHHGRTAPELDELVRAHGLGGVAAGHFPL